MSKVIDFTYCSDTIKLKNSLEVGFIELGKRLQKIRDEELYKPQFDCFDLFCEEMKMTESKASRLISVYQRLVVEYEIDPELISKAGGWSDVYSITNKINNKEDAVEWLEKASQLTSTDLRKELSLAKVGGSCEHNFKELHIKQCTACGLKEKVYDTNR